MRILVFGGTGEAIDLANGLVRQGHQVTTSLAGRTRKPRLPNGHIHTGGFGGTQGLIDFIGRNGFEMIIDATHPFAATMSTHIVDACVEMNKPMLRLTREAWQASVDDNWNHVSDIEAAAKQLPADAHALVTVGRQHIEPLVLRTDCKIFVRAIEHPEVILPSHVTVILERPPFRLSDELAFMRKHEITHLVSKNAGGGQTAAKLEAARMVGAKVIMIERPLLPEAPEVYSVDAALQFVADHSASAA
ncbi:cobalt-precorrin-6A reductase [Maritalea porphyrae]|uniref:cobalt-precorrin-6A reductase n=1 Tax=Maritalea porphyrae TaxID=880732 RepID=UPI0022AFB0CF|nr:cobalt-precorrin-6A reductase [Maritalea porphyrae]MCZ4271765.1 cobalt-precorrin-6A reductase [Maritalea porphyrae]